MATVPTTFAEKYSQQSPVSGADFYHRTYNYHTLGPADLFNQMTEYIGNQDSAIGLLWVQSSDHNTTVHYVHNLFCYTPTIGKPSQWDTRCFGIIQDITFGGRYAPQPVEVTKHIFGKASPKVRVPTLERFYDSLTTTLANNPSAFALEPIENDAPNSEEISPRVGLIVPPQILAKLVAHQGGMPAFEFWDVICRPLMDTDQDRADYKHVLDFSRALCVRTSNDACVLRNNMDSGGVRFLIPDPAILQWARQTTDRMLPLAPVVPPPPAPAATTTTTAGASDGGTAATDLLTAFQQHQMDAANKKKKVSTKLPGTYKVLQRIMQSEDEDDFPPFWKEFATADKASRPGIVENALQQAVMDIGGNLAVPPAATAHLVESLTLGCFASNDQDHLTGGTTIFTIVTTSAGISQNQEEISVYAASYGGNAVPTTSDLHRLAKSSAVLPATALQAMTQLGGYLALFYVTLGKNCSFTTAFKSFYEKVRPEFERAEGYLQSQEGPPLPPYNEIIDHLAYRSFSQFPSLPPAYISKAAPAPNRVVQEAPPANNDKAPKAKKESSTRSETVVNKDHLSPALVSCYCQFVNSEAGKPIKELVAKPGITKPLTDNLPKKRENQLCLNYHLSESCHDLCPRKKQHRRLTNTEEQKVGQFLTDANVP